MMEKLTKVNLTNLDKVLYPKLNITKAQFIEYYIKMAPKILPFLKDRPLVLIRCPSGIDGECFYEKDAPDSRPDWVKTARFYSTRAKHDISYVVGSDLDTLTWLANLATIEIHMPLSRVDTREEPDFLFFDVDPEPPATIEDAAKAALALNEVLEKLGFKSYVKTSGKKGLHVLVPIERAHVFEQTRAFVHRIGRYMAKEMDLVVSELSESRKPGKVFIDYTQNSHGKTMVCPYSLRITPQATVSTPLEWSDMKKKIKPAEFNISSVPSLRKDPWKDIFLNRQKLEVK